MTVVKAGIGVIVVKDGKILTGIRKGSHGEGRRAFPGGHIDPEDNSFIMAGHREVEEECGIKIIFRQLENGGYDLFTTFDILSEDGEKRYVTTYLVADYASGGIWIDENTLQGAEPDKCEKWELNTWADLQKLIMAEEKDIEPKFKGKWIPVKRIHASTMENKGLLHFSSWHG